MGGASGRAAPTAALRATAGSRRKSPIRTSASPARRWPPSRYARYAMSLARSSASGSSPSSSSGMAAGSTRRGSSARLLIRISWLATAMNELTWPIRSTSSVASASR